VTSAGASQAEASAISTFESSPVASCADTGYGAAVETAAQPSQHSTYESDPAQSKAEVGYFQTSTAGDGSCGPSVFESCPVESKAHAKAGVDGAASESEYETDEESA